MTNDISLDELKHLFLRTGCSRLYVKPLAENDNSKNQVYFGGDFRALNVIPFGEIMPSSVPKNKTLKAGLHFSWLLRNGSVCHAPKAQLILYPQYPEVRFSGFLQGCPEAPSDLMRGRMKDRLLFIGVSAEGTSVGFVTEPGSLCAKELNAQKVKPDQGVFLEIALPNTLTARESRVLLLREIARIHLLGWIDSKQLDSDGTIRPCHAPQCGGYTLEAELGIPKNSRSGPDYLGWEVKQHGVTSLDVLQKRPITLMTPEPTGGFYREQGAERFARRFGYPDKLNRPDRTNFGGIYRIGRRHPDTKLRMVMYGYDATLNKITDPHGCIALITDTDEIAAAWDFPSLLKHWGRKHANAAYIPSQFTKEPHYRYRYGSNIRLASGTDALLFLRALAREVVYYDPGIKIENASGAGKVKKRSQFRVCSTCINELYQQVDSVNALSYHG